MLGDDEIKGTQVVAEELVVALMLLAEVAVQRVIVEEVLKDELMINLGDDYEEYPEMELNEEEEVDCKEAKVELEGGEKGKVVVADGQTSMEVQDLKNRVLLLEEMWKMERALREMTEERNELKAQIKNMGVECSKPKKEKGKNKRKRINDSGNYSGKQQEDSQLKVMECTNCGKKHFGKCMKGKNVCYNCGQGGHMSPNCPKPKKGGCFACGGVGHRFKKCPNKRTYEGSDQKKV